MNMDNKWIKMLKRIQANKQAKTVFIDSQAAKQILTFYFSIQVMIIKLIIGHENEFETEL
jgi:hypothetical protein